MKPNHLEKLLQQEAPPPDPAARLAARRAALAEFARANPNTADEPAASPGIFKALLDGLRLSRNSDGRDSMPWYQRRMLLGGAASVCIVLVGATVMWETQRQQPEVTELRAAEPQPEVYANSATPPADTAAMQAPVAGQERNEPAAIDKAKPDERQALAGQEGGKLETREGDGRSRIEVAPAMQEAAAAPTVDFPLVVTAAPAAAAPPTRSSATDERGDLGSVVVTDQRAKLQSSMEVKREAVGAVQSQDLEEVVVAPTGKGAQTSHKSMVPAQRTSGGWSKGTSGVLANVYSPPEPPLPPTDDVGRDKFEQFDLNPVKLAVEEPVSTFSADVDTSSYSFIRGQLNQGVLPQKDAVRAEEMINYFDYAWPAAESRERPFKPTVVVSDSPWGKGHKLIHIGIKGYELPANQRPDANLVMLLDVSGSMSSPDKLPLVKQSMKLLLGSLKATDTVGIVVYAGAAGLVLPPTPVSEKAKIVAALDNLTPGGSTAGAEGIALAYQLAEQSFRKEGVNRILLCTDGDFNVGIDSTHELKGFVERKREKGVFLSVLGFGQGNYRDELAQALAQNGNGVAAYIDTLSEAQKVLVQESGSSLFTIAKDVKLQVEFNPATVAEYRLVGYETRALKREDFNNDKVDAGDVGAGHAVTAIYEITPVGVDARMVEENRYGKKPQPAATSSANEYGYLKIRYKLPKEDKSQLIETPISMDSGKLPEAIRRDVQFSTAVAGFAQLLRGGKYTGALSYDDVIKQALAARGEDAYGYRNEFVQLVRKAQTARGM